MITLPLTDLYSPVSEDLTTVERIFDDELNSELACVNTLCDGVRSYRGKMLRPALLLLSARATGELSAEHHSLAAVVELVHMATLVHDDVLDGADERRGQLPVSATDGNVAAVLLGDYLISHAFHLCSGLKSQFASRQIGATTNAVCEGELLQNRHRGDTEMTQSVYFDVIRRKTGALTAVSCELGAWQAGADATVVRAMHRYGMSAGVAFQIIDDVLDLVGDRAKVRKTLSNDLAMGKLTLPTLHCRDTAEPDTAERLRAIVAGKAEPDADQLRVWLDRTDSIEYAVSVAREHVCDALAQLELLPPSDARTSLSALAEFIVHRQF